MVTTPTLSEYRIRLTGLLGAEGEALVEAIASSVYSRILHSLSREACYSATRMAELFSRYYKELLESDRGPKTKDRYWQVVQSYRKWLGARQPDVATAKEGWMIRSVGIDLHEGQHRVRCLDERAQLCDGFSFQTTPQGLATLKEHIFGDGSNPIIVFEPAGLAWVIVAIYLRARHPDCRLVKAKGQKVAALRRYLRGSVKSERCIFLAILL